MSISSNKQIQACTTLREHNQYNKTHYEQNQKEASSYSGGALKI